VGSSSSSRCPRRRNPSPPLRLVGSGVLCTAALPAGIFVVFFAPFLDAQNGRPHPGNRERQNRRAGPTPRSYRAQRPLRRNVRAASRQLPLVSYLETPPPLSFCASPSLSIQTNCQVFFWNRKD